MGKKIRRSWWLGFMAAFACNSLVQDVMGQQGYIEHIRDHWASGYYTVPLAVAMLVYSLWNRDKLYEVGHEEADAKGN